MWTGLSSKALLESFMSWKKVNMPNDTDYVEFLTGLLACEGYFEDEEERLECVDLLSGAKIWEGCSRGGKSCA